LSLLLLGARLSWGGKVGEGINGGICASFGGGLFDWGFFGSGSCKEVIEQVHLSIGYGFGSGFNLGLVLLTAGCTFFIAGGTSGLISCVPGWVASRSALSGIWVARGTNVEDDSGLDWRAVGPLDVCVSEGSTGFRRRVRSTCIIGAKRLLCVIA
jgi:hypothetical protein